MDALRDLTYIINRYAVRDIDVITNPDKKKNKEESRYWEFYAGLEKDIWKTEEEMAKHFGYKTKSDKGFRRLKEGLKERLLNTTLFIDLTPDEFTDHNRNVQQAIRLTAISEFLLKRGAVEIYLEVAEKALSLAIETDMNITIIQLLISLRTTYTLKPKYAKDLEKCNALYQKYWKIFTLESDAQNDYLFLAANLKNKKGYRKDFAPLANEFFQKYKDQLEITQSLMFQVYVRVIEVYSKVLEHKWQEGVESCDRSILYFQQNIIRGRDFISTFNTQKASCLLMLSRFDESIETLETYKTFIPEGKASWFKNREIAAVTSLYAGYYQQAWDLVQLATNHERLNLISDIDQETWRLYHGYLHFISKVRNENYAKNDDAVGGKFRISRWLNEMPTYAQDKRGGNIPLLILQILFLVSELQENKNAFDEIGNRAEALRKYGSRNLDRESDHYRTDCFINLIMLLPKHLNQPKNLQKAAHNLLEKMKGIQSEVVDNSFEIEVVPYERQWEWIMHYALLHAGK